MKLPKPTIIEWLCLPIGLLVMWRYAWLMDDSFIYFRYVDNLLWLKLGLVYNAGEYVEGFSSPLWLAVLTFFRMLHLNFWAITVGLGVVSCLAFWLGLIVLDRQLWNGSPRLNFPMVFLLVNYGVGTYFTSGLEAPWVQLYAVLYALLILNPTNRWLTVAIAFSPLLRQEMALCVALCAAWLWYRNRAFPSLLVILSGALVACWLLFRIYYYADLFPNTFYLKDSVWFSQGLDYLHDTAKPYHLYPISVFFVLVVMWAIRTGRAAQLNISSRLMMLAVAAIFTAYVVKIGGDSRHFRYLAFPFCLVVIAYSGLLELMLSRLSKPRLLAYVTAVAVLGTSFAAYPRQLRQHPFSLKGKARYRDRIGDAMAHRRKTDLNYTVWKNLVTIDLLNQYRDSHQPFTYSEIAVTHWCRSGYVGYHKKLIHGLGLTDAILGRTDCYLDRPAHRWGLVRLGFDLQKIQRTIPEHDRGLYRKAIEAQIAPEWISKQIDIIEVIEKKIYNRHDFRENLQLAFTRIPKLREFVSPQVMEQRKRRDQERARREARRK
jgi:hypothetical protein